MLPAHATAEVIAHLDDVDLGEALEEMDEAALSKLEGQRFCVSMCGEEDLLPGLWQKLMD